MDDTEGQDRRSYIHSSLLILKHWHNCRAEFQPAVERCGHLLQLVRYKCLVVHTYHMEH